VAFLESVQFLSRACGVEAIKMHYDDNFDREVYDPDRTDKQALDDREGSDVLDQAAWNDESDPVAHL
jgi:hypothetical protein